MLPAYEFLTIYFRRISPGDTLRRFLMSFLISFLITLITPIAHFITCLTTHCLDALYPRRCPVCDEIVMPKGALICPSCFPKLSYVKGPTCKKCGKQVFSETIEYCYDCTRRRHSFEHGLALINYDDYARHSMAAIKYNNKRQYLDFYGEAICQRYGPQILRMNAQALIPVPIHPSRKRRRGFNQAELLADIIGARLSIPVCPSALLRSKKTAPQKQLTPTERLKNLQQAFQPGDIPSNIKDVILVDDIYTTGSTIEACTRVLLTSGIRRVCVITICIGHGS